MGVFVDSGSGNDKVQMQAAETCPGTTGNRQQEHCIRAAIHDAGMIAVVILTMRSLKLKQSVVLVTTASSSGENPRSHQTTEQEDAHDLAAKK